MLFIEKTVKSPLLPSPNRCLLKYLGLEFTQRASSKYTLRKVDNGVTGFERIQIISHWMAYIHMQCHDTSYTSISKSTPMFPTTSAFTALAFYA